MRVFITGGTGLIGSALVDALIARGDTAVVLSRAMRAGPTGTEYVGGRTSEEGHWGPRVAGCDAVVHLAAEPLAHWRWTEAHERRVRRSRIDGTQAVVAALATVPSALRPRRLIYAASTDIYRFDSDDERYAEDGLLGDHLLAEIGRSAQAAAETAREHGVSVTTFRTGMVLANGKHSFTQLVNPYKLWFRGPIGTGEQWLSWIHIDDVVAAYLAALDGRLEAQTDGIYNLVAPGAIRQSDLARAVAVVLKRAPWAPLSERSVRGHLGPFADYLLAGRRVIPRALATAGFQFRRQDAPAALAASLAPLRRPL